MKRKLRANTFQTAEIAKNSAQSGFSLVEVAVALLILLVTLLGVAMSFTYATSYNTGNSTRAQALAILQQEVENIRSQKFTPMFTDSQLLGGTKPDRIVPAAGGGRFRVSIIVDDDTSNAGVQVLATSTLKEISVTVSTENPTPGWQFSVPITAVLRRVREN
jgi:prepilin-type N-terminal cleavage/methylation domain-containing protein